MHFLDDPSIIAVIQLLVGVLLLCFGVAYFSLKSEETFRPNLRGFSQDLQHLHLPVRILVG